MIVKLNMSIIQKLMAAKSISGTDLAKMTNLSRQSISTILHRKTCNIKNAGVIAKALDVSFEDIVDEEH